MCKFVAIEIFGIWPQASKQASTSIADTHTHVRNAVTLVWGSLRLAPINIKLQTGVPDIWLHNYNIVVIDWLDRTTHG